MIFSAIYKTIIKYESREQQNFSSSQSYTVGSGGAVRVWRMLDFKYPEYFNVAILAPKIAGKH